MFTGKKKILTCVLLIIILAALVTSHAFAAGGAEHVSGMYGTFWSLIPPVIAITLALITKEVYSSLFIGIVAGALFYSDFNLEMTLNTILVDGFTASLSDPWNVGILIFLVVLGITVVLMNRAGGSSAYGSWARKRIKSKRGAAFATFALGIIIFVDDYFNCLTVGSVMRPVTDKFGISRAKLAYLIDATAAPICMIAPVSSWAAAVSGVVEGYNGIDLFIRAIPYNFYSLLTIVMIVFISAKRFDYGPMAIHERNAEKGDLYTTSARPYAGISETGASAKGKVIDLVFPIIVLVVCCIGGMVYTGGLFSGTGFIDSFADCDPSVGLSMGSVIALIIIVIYMVAGGALKFKECAEAIPDGFKAMVPAILILTFAWTLSGMTGLLGGADYVAGLVEAGAENLKNFLPAIVFIIACFLAFATGTSWGTFGILIPIVVKVFANIDPTLLIIGISACLAGAVCGDHCSPISDTTIMSSSGAQCDHMNHVLTQLPYTLTVAFVSFAAYIITAFVNTIWIVLPVAVVLMILVLFGISIVRKKKPA
ncbi:MAG: Na+/H+ antiporter NhaC family protein [Oscillospiraceae bacterium]|nr:Na+/H+ antiporter NhaC family protein [Oscillospiraceae bacterium]